MSGISQLIVRNARRNDRSFSKGLVTQPPALSGGLVWTALSCAPPPQAKPNIAVIFADDPGYGDLSSCGANKVQTPHCDRLAREGTRFTDAHSPSAVCSLATPFSRDAMRGGRG